MPYNFGGEVFTQRNFVADFLRQNLVGHFLLVITELFFDRCFRFVRIHTCDGQTDGRTDGHMDVIAIMKTTLAYNVAR